MKPAIWEGRFSMASENKIKSNNCLRLMYIKEIIFEHTDEDHFLNTSELIEMLKAD